MTRSRTVSRVPQSRSHDSNRPRFSGKTWAGMSLHDTLKEQAEGRPESLIEKTPQDYFLIGKKLGEGGMGKVYKATSVKTTRSGKKVMEKTVALKVINFDSDYAKTDPAKAEEKQKEMIERFLVEVQLVAKLEHENIVTIIDFGETDDGRPFFIMEYLEGQDLEQLVLKSGALSWEETKSLMLQVCSALQAAHEYRDEDGNEKPIIHRDIKPMNIFVCGNGDGLKVKVLDFGLAKILEPAGEGVTKKGEAAGGTPDYMPPEQAWGLKVDHRSDIYSLGSVMYHLLSGNPPFTMHLTKEARDFNDSKEWAKYLYSKWEEFRERLWKQPPAPLGRKGIGIPTNAEQIVMKCLAKDPTERFQSVRELREAIEACVPQKSDPRLQETLPPLEGVEEGLEYAPTEETDLKELVARTAGPDVAKLESLRARPSPEPVAGAIGSITDPAGRRKSRLPRRFYAIAGCMMALGAITGITLSQVDRHGPEAGRPAIHAPSKPSHDSGVALNMPINEPIMPDSGPSRQDATPLVKRTITIRTNVGGVLVHQGDEEVCRIGGSREYRMERPQSDDGVELVFRKPGYIPSRRRVVFDGDGTITVLLEKQPAKTPQKQAPRIISVE